MRKFLAFVLLFGAGLLILDWLEGETETEVEGAPPTRSDAIPPIPSAAPHGVGIRGRFDGVLYDERTKRSLLRIQSDDSRTEESADVLTNVHVDILDPESESGDVIGRIDAREAHLLRVEGSAAFRPEYQNIVALSDIEALLEGALPISSVLTVHSPGAELRADDPNHVVLESDEPLRFESPELKGTSLGYHIDIMRTRETGAGIQHGHEGGHEAEELMELRREGSLEFKSSTEEGVQTARFRSTGTGALQVRSTGEEDPRPIVLEAWEGAALELGGRFDPRLEARHLLLDGSSARDADTIRLRRLEADGDVLWTSTQGIYRAQNCALEFDELSQLSEARLLGFPSVRFFLSVDSGQLEDLSDEERRALEEIESVRVASEEEIELEVLDAQAVHFRAAGPATVEASEVGLRSNGDVLARLSEDGRTIALEGSGGVKVESADAELLTANFELTVAKADLGSAGLHGVAWGGTRLEGNTEDGRHFVITSPERLEVERLNGAWRVIEGVQVQISVGEEGTPSAFFASCDRLTDFHVEASRFEAFGNVVFEGDGRRAVGDRLVAHNRSHMEMWGTKDSQVRFTSDKGHARANYVEVEGDRLFARGAVEATLSSRTETDVTVEGLSFDRYELKCAELFLLRTEAQRGTITERLLDVAARGNVSSTLVTEGRTILLEHADEMIVERFERTQSIAGGAEEGLPLESTTRLEASGAVRSHLTIEEEEIDLACEELLVTRATTGDLEPAQEVQASGNVRFAGSTSVDFQGQGDQLEIRPDRTATLSANESGSVKLTGVLPSRGIPFRMTATSVDFSEDEIRATNPDLYMRGHRAQSRHLVATRESMELVDDVLISGATREREWTLRSGVVSLAEDPRAEEEPDATVDRSDWDSPSSTSLLSRLRAREGFIFELGDMIIATGDSLTSGGELGVLRMTGEPMATISSPFGIYEAEWIEFDPALQIVVATGPGRIRGQQGLAPSGVAGGDGGPSGPGQLGAQEEWIVDFLSSSTMFDGNTSLVYLMQEPTFTYPVGDRKLRASWVVLWLDRATWRGFVEPSETGERKLQPTPPPTQERPAGVMGLFFDAVTKSDVPGLVRALYFEGPVEAFEGEERVALADAVYFDLKSGHGYLVNAAVTITGKRFGGKFEQISVKANVLRHGTDGSLRARNATITPCSFDEPHVRIVTGDLRLTPLPDSPDAPYEISLHDNRIEFDWLQIPLPPLESDLDENLKPLLPSLRFGDSARFGQLFGIRLRGSAKRIGRGFDWLFSVFTGGDDDDDEASASGDDVSATADGEPVAPRKKRSGLKAHYDLDASYLGSRGALFDLGLTTEKPGSYWFEFLTGIAFDSGRDKGYVRVPEGDRDLTRLWLRSQGWFDLGNHQRLVTAYSDQSDPGVQSEFFESEFTSHERAESYVQWKRAKGNVWMQASVQPRVDEFRAGVEELPSFSAYRGRASIAKIGALPLIWSGDLETAYLRRVTPRPYDLNRDGIPESTLASPFGPSGVYPDGTASHDALRLDSFQLLELPMPLGLLGAKLIPFASVRGTSWSTAAQEDEATRLVTEAGARISTVFWKKLADASFHQVAPYVQYRTELSNDSNGVPHVFDETETQIFGDFVEVGTRARFGVEGGRSLFDLDVQGTYVTDRSDGRPGGWLPIEIYSSLGLGTERRPFDVWYDTRFDARVGETIYSQFVVGTRIEDEIGVQLSHNFGRDDAFRKQFDAISTRGFYRWTEKWEFEVEHSFSLIEDQRLGFDLLVRRYGHDVIFELETSVREGEGSSVGFSVRPRLGFRPRSIGIIRY